MSNIMIIIPISMAVDDQVSSECEHFSHVRASTQ